MSHVELFAVPPGEDDAFLAAWREEARPAVLYRALRDDVDFRFVEIGEAGPTRSSARTARPTPRAAAC